MDYGSNKDSMGDGKARASPINTNARSSTSPTLGFVGASSSTGNTSSGNSAPKIRRRNRMITSCLECRRRKLKCNKSHPCTNCMKFSRDCVFLAPALDQASQLKLTEIKEKVGSLERLLERDVAQKPSPNNVTSPGGSQRSLPAEEDDNLPGLDDEKDLEPTPLAVSDAAYEDGGEEDDELLDLGILMGKLRMTERIGGFFRPKMSQELDQTLAEERTKAANKIGSTTRPLTDEHMPLPPPHDYLKPGPSYIAPSSGFFFGQGANPASLIDFLPSRLAADRLITQYFAFVHPVARVVHRPTFEREYSTFWDEVSLGIEPSHSVQTVVFAAMFSGVVSMDEAIILRDFGATRASLIENFRLGTETALSRANFLRTTKVETLQGFVMYLLPLCRSEVSRAHSVLVAAAIKQAECMGIHRDGENYGLSPLETHIRRLIWHQLCFLDIRTCEATGPRPTIRRDDFDTKLPFNVDDEDILPTGPHPQNRECWTEVTLSNIRFECIEMTRTVWVDRPRLERRKISLTAVLSKIETFRRNMASNYDSWLDERIPIQKLCKLLMSCQVCRMILMVLHRYHNSASAAMPDRLRKIMLANGAQALEDGIAIESLPELKQWAWYSGAYQQFHSAYTLLLEVFIYPMRKEADRIWKCLDYIYEVQRFRPEQIATREAKARTLVTEMREKTGVFQQMRKMRAPASMEKHVESKIKDPLPNPLISGSGHRIKQEEMPFAPNMHQLPMAASPGGLAPSNMVYAGEANGESYWTFPNHQSPEGTTSDSNSSFVDQRQPSSSSGRGGSLTDSMADIDWVEFGKLFPDMGELNQAPVSIDLTQPTSNYTSELPPAQFPNMQQVNLQPGMQYGGF